MKITNKIRSPIDNINVTNKNKTMKTLLERLKPEIRLKLESNKNEYESSIATILTELGNNFFYDDLKIRTISSIYTFADINLIKTSVWDLKFGENILKTTSGE